MSHEHGHKDLEFTGKITAITKLRTNTMMVKISIEGGVYVEVNCDQDAVLFEKLVKAFELDKGMKIILAPA